MRLLCLLALSLLVAPLDAQPHSRQPQPLKLTDLPADARAALRADGDANWDDRFGHPSLAYTAYAMTVAPNGDLYIGGTFTQIGGIPANNIARWDGRRWHALGKGIGNGSGYVYALAVGPDGALYAGGYFASAGNVQTGSIARWDPTTQTWSALGPGLSNGGYTGYVYALAFQGPTLYAGGDFTASGQTPMLKFARWTGAAWENLGAGLGSLTYDGKFQPDGPYDVRALATRGTDIYVGGRFDAVAEGRANSLARFDATTGTFHVVGGGVGSGMQSEYRGSVAALAVDAAQVCVGGQFDRVGLLAGTPSAASNVACWNGTSWNTLDGGLQRQYGAQVNSLTLTLAGLVATGNFESASGQQVRDLARWNGTAWVAVGDGLGNDGNAVVSDGATGFYVTGGFDTVGDNFGALRMAHWDGQGWKALGQGLSYSTIVATVNALAVRDGFVYAGGGQTHAGGVATSHVSAWDGTAWNALGAGVGTQYDDVYATVIGPDGALYVGGSFTTAGGKTANRIARWDPIARTWSALGNGVNGKVYALAVAPNGDLYAGGEFTTAGNVEAKYIARWNGQAWSAVGGGVNYNVYALAVGTDGRVYAGGWFDKAGGNPANRIAIWNGTNWSALGGGLGSSFGYKVYAIALVGNDVYVGGNFDATATTAAAGIARWSQATGWTALGAGLGGGDQDVYALHLRGTELYAGGNFETAGDQQAGSIARWNTATETWSVLGSGVGGDYRSVRALASSGNTLYVGGRFVTAGGAPSAGFGAYQLATQTAQAQLELDPTQVNFGDQAVGTTADLLISVGNAATATAPLTGTVSLPAGSPYSLVQGGGAFTVQPGGVHEVVVRFAPQAAGAATATVSVQHNAPGTPTPATVTLTGNGTARGGRIVLRGFDPNGPQTTPGATPGGFVFGTNGYGDRAKGVALTLPVGKNMQTALVTAVRVWFSYADPLPGDATYTLALYSGTAQTGPQGSPLYSKVYRVADVQADDDLGTPSQATEHAISPALSLAPGTSFFVVVDFSAYASRTNLLAIAAGDLVQQRIPEVWEQDANGTWGNMSDLWKGGQAGWPVWIEAELGTPTAVDDAPGALTLSFSGAAPTPFNASTTIRYALPEAGPVVLDVYDLTGRRVVALVEGVQPAGPHTATLHADGLASGTYLVRLQASGQTLSRSVVVAR